MYRGDPSAEVCESTVSVHSTAHGGSARCRRYASLPMNACSLTLGRVMPASTSV